MMQNKSIVVNKKKTVVNDISFYLWRYTHKYFSGATFITLKNIVIPYKRKKYII